MALSSYLRSATLISTAVMYGSIVISKMTSNTETHPIDSIQELLNRRELKIFVQKNSFVEDLLKESSFYPILKPRFDE